ncbi:cytochrome cd1-nitrite reductase-like protein [Annulohypoxylon truncatum]|uniref:cytochrome cd1-nitrite reductase-like protein n=1 Tax=Annulohypoxylon truncatum TaxID=327061 RepID=UPI00200727B6|nr:cytochrome cd1-nitrite reductase-like protein [Annulohypoxylon truncatum]KAI1208532.1 cytochrome cd1-nitrite reductase-like protein [Annulohypoxylon truncatum]
MARSLAYLVATITSAAFTAAATIANPGCQATAPSQGTINVPTANMTVPGSPFGLVYARPDFAFAGMGQKVIMLNTSAFKPALAREIALPASFNQSGVVVGGITLSHDKRHVYAAIGPGAVILDVEKAILGHVNPVVGTLVGKIGDSAIQVTLSADDQYALVTQEYGTNATRYKGTIEVFQMHQSRNGSMTGVNKGFTTLGYAVVGTAFSHDQSKVYVTSEVTAAATSANETQGTVSVLDAATLYTNPSKALLHSVDAGCSPVRLEVSPDGKLVWVTARQSNRLLAFDTAKLDSAHPEGALAASVQVGTSPVGLAIINGGRHIITADSNRFNSPNATTGLTVVDVEEALRGEQGFRKIPTGMFPREFAVSPDGKTVLVAQYQSDAIQALDVAKLL